MKKHIIFLFTIYFCMNLFAQNYPKGTNSIRLLTYNTHYCKGGYDPGTISDYNTQRFALVIKALDADIVSLQELDSGAISRGKRYLLKQIADATGLKYTPIYGSSTNWDGGSIGCGTLVKSTYPVMKIKKIPLPGDEPRIAVRTDFDKFVFISTHFDLNDSKRIQGAGIICSEMDYIRKPAFLAGDLNDSHRWNGGIAFPTLLDKFTIVSDVVGASIPHTTNTNSLIDYILLRDYGNSNIKIIQTHIVRTIEINGSTIDLGDISDHYPVFVDIEFENFTGIENIKNTQFKAYSNPADNLLNLQCEQPISQIIVYSNYGQKLMNLCDENIKSIDVSGLSKGFYIVEVFSDNKCYKTKFFKK